MQLKGLGYIGVESADPEAWGKFATGVLGLMRVDGPPPLGESSAPAGSVWLRMDNRSWRLAIHPSASEGLGYVGWELADQAAFDGAVVELEAAGVAVEQPGAADRNARAVKGLVRFRDPFDNVHELFYGHAVDEAEFVSPAGVSGFLTAGVGMGHVLYAVPSATEAVEFFTKVLGFKVTDSFAWGPNSAVFMRTTPRHHSLAVIDLPLPGGPGLNHFMIEAHRVTDVGRAYDRAMDLGVPIVNSLGQHSNDPMFSFYMQSPSGFNVEVGCDGLMVDDATWTVTTWTGRGEIWGHRGDFMDDVAEAKEE